MKVSNLASNRTGRPVSNQFTIVDNGIQYFQSYNSIIVKIEDNITYLDIDYYQYSKTTVKYRNIYLNLTSRQIDEKIKSGEFRLTSLNFEV